MEQDYRRVFCRLYFYVRGNVYSRAGICFLLGAGIAAYGGIVFVKRDFPIYLFLKSEFVFLDYGEPIFSFYGDYLALMGTCIFIVHYILKIIRNAKKA